MSRRPYPQVRAAKLRRYQRMVTRFKFLLADKPEHPDAPEWKARLDYFERCMEYHGNSPYILSKDALIVDKIRLRIFRLENLSRFYRMVNKAHRKGTGFDQIILTRYWETQIQKNIQEFGLPFPEKFFWRIRTLLKYFRNRLKKEEIVK